MADKPEKSELTRLEEDVTAAFQVWDAHRALRWAREAEPLRPGGKSQ